MPLLDFHFTPFLALKMFGSLVVSVLGFYYLASGKKNMEPQTMLLGAALILASFIIF